MPNSIALGKQAAKFLENLRDAKLYQRISRVLGILSQASLPSGAKKIKGTANLYRIRIGEHRMIYQIGQNQILSPSLNIAAKFTNS